MHTDGIQVVREKDAANLLGVSVAALRRWRREQRGPDYVRVEGCVGYQLAALESFLISNTVGLAGSRAEEKPMGGAR